MSSELQRAFEDFYEWQESIGYSCRITCIDIPDDSDANHNDELTKWISVIVHPCLYYVKSYVSSNGHQGFQERYHLNVYLNY